MSRSGYSDDYEHMQLYRQAVHRATTGFRGQYLLRRLRDALSAMPVKRLIADAIKDEHGDVCVFGALDPDAPFYDAAELAKHFGIAYALAAEIVYMNDEYFSWRRDAETPEGRWTRIREWVESQITPEEAPSVDAVDPVGGEGQNDPRA